MTREQNGLIEDQRLDLGDFQRLLAQVAYDPDRVRNLEHTAAYLGTTKGAVDGLIKRGELKSLRIGNANFIAQSAIHEWIERQHKQQDRERFRREVVRDGVDPEVQKSLKKR